MRLLLAALVLFVHTSVADAGAASLTTSVDDPRTSTGQGSSWPRDLGVSLLPLLATAVVSRRRRYATGTASQLPNCFGGMVGRSVAMRALFARLARIARSDATILIEGDTGTGKATCAESIHRESARSEAPLIVVDCGSTSSNLLERELFGEACETFSGGADGRAGAFDLASGGTLFLDDVSELDEALQRRLLRALDQSDPTRVGDAKLPRTDVRVIAAANGSLLRSVEAGRFRADLYYRLAVVGVRLPPLRERSDDIPLLVESFLAELAAERDTPNDWLRAPELIVELQHKPWHGNVRELRNFIERYLVLGEVLACSPDVQELSEHHPIVDSSRELRLVREEWNKVFERRYLDDVLRRTGGNVSAAARAAGVDRVHFHRLLRKHQMR